MAKITLAVKYRPRTFDDVVAQESIRAILQEQIDTNTFKNSYLFCGPAGCGKTTAARIFANEVNKGKGFPIEVDAASNNGVDDVREIINNAKRKSLDSEYKVYILDEVHMLSTGAWNAMLKLLEEPPSGTVFIMCTTDPQKIPATILSRVQRYDFTKIPYSMIVERLKYISENEAINISDESVDYIAKLADGGMRDAITMLDKCISLSNVVTLETVVSALGAVDYEVHFSLLEALCDYRTTSALEIVEETYLAGKDLKQFMRQFQSFVLDACKFNLFNSAQYLSIPTFKEYLHRLSELDVPHCVEVLEICREINNTIKWESNPKVIIQSMIILRGDK